MIATYERWREERFFPRLEGIRAVAALLVVFHHARAHWLWGAVAGWNGVTLFFVLSGFLITTLGLREEERLGALRWGAFFVRRAFRILPLYVVSLGLYAGLVLVVGLGAAHRESFVHAVPWYLSPFPEHVFFGRAHAAFALSWSLGIEEKFYFVWPLLAFVLLRRRFRARLAVALAAGVAFQVPVAIWAGGRVVAPYTAILAGCALAFLMHRPSTFAHVAKLGTRRGLALSFGALLGVHVLTSVLLPMSNYAQVATPFYYLPYSLAAAAFVASVALRSRGSGLLETPPLRFGGRVSYGLYLIHPIGLAFAERAVPAGGIAHETIALALGISLSLGTAYALHHVVERPLIRAGRRLAARETFVLFEPWTRRGSPSSSPATMTAVS